MRLYVHDLGGRRLATLVDAPHPAGDHAVAWNGLGPDGRAAAAGTCFLTLQAEEVMQTRKVVFLGTR